MTYTGIHQYFAFPNKIQSVNNNTTHEELNKNSIVVWSCNMVYCTTSTGPRRHKDTSICW